MISVRYGIGQKVTVRVLEEKAIVVAVKISSGGHVEYLCRWFHDGTAKCEYLIGDEIEADPRDRKMGFKVEGV